MCSVEFKFGALSFLTKLSTFGNLVHHISIRSVLKSCWRLKCDSEVRHFKKTFPLSSAEIYSMLAFMFALALHLSVSAMRGGSGVNKPFSQKALGEWWSTAQLCGS